MLTSHLKALIFFAILGLMIHGCFSLAFGQSRPDSLKAQSVTLDKSKVSERMAQIKNAIQKRQQEILDNDGQLREMIGLYNGLATAVGDPTLAPMDSTKLKK